MSIDVTTSVITLLITWIEHLLANYSVIRVLLPQPFLAEGLSAVSLKIPQIEVMVPCWLEFEIWSTASCIMSDFTSAVCFDIRSVSLSIQADFYCY
jgi:hypothetical protein